MMRSIAPAAVLLPLLLGGCGEDETRRPPQNTTSITSGTSAEGGAGGETAAGGGGAGGTAMTGGSGGFAPTGSGGDMLCGNGKIDPGEACDGDALGGVTCETQGFPGGTLACSPACGLDISACTGAEQCTDGIDNDGDALVDCAEAECKPACDDPCLAPQLLGDAGEAPGALAGHADVLAPSCAADSGGGEIAYSFTAMNTGVIEVTLIDSGAAALNVSLRTSCAAGATELACTGSSIPGRSNLKKLIEPITAGETVIVVVDGGAAGASGSYTLSVLSRPITCGDAVEDPSEGCDDGAAVGGDGCSATCAVEATEQEPNGTIASANSFSAPWFGQIDDAGDSDLVKVVLPQTATLVATISGLGDGTCLDGTLDSMLTVLDAAGNVLGENDDHAGMYCSRAVVSGLAAGTYYVRTTAANVALPAGQTFPYSLAIETFECGDGTPSLGEECDDGNLMASDGCSPTCTLEVDETEPNGTLATADAYTSPWFARIDPDGDIDVVSITVPGPASKLTAMTFDPTSSAACFGLIDTFVEILKPDGTVLGSDDDGAEGNCSLTVAQNLPAGKYLVRVQAPLLLGQSNVYVYPYGLDLKVE